MNALATRGGDELYTERTFDRLHCYPRYQFAISRISSRPKVGKNPRGRDARDREVKGPCLQTYFVSLLTPQHIHCVCIATFTWPYLFDHGHCRPPLDLLARTRRVYIHSSGSLAPIELQCCERRRGRSGIKTKYSTSKTQKDRATVFLMTFLVKLNLS